MIKNAFMACMLMIPLFFLGCQTVNMWQDQQDSITVQKDEITAFLYSKDANQSIFISDKYHYITNPTPQLSFLLDHRNDINITLSVISFDVQKNNAFSAFIKAHFDFNGVRPEVLDEFKKLQYEPFCKTFKGLQYEPFSGKIITDKRICENTVEFNIKGQRYLSDSRINTMVTPLKKPIKITFVEEKSQSSVVANKILKTPLSVASDGGLVMMGVIFFPFTYIVLHDIYIDQPRMREPFGYMKH